MAISLYMDHHVPSAVTAALRLRNVNVLTAEEDGTNTWPDDRLLDRAAALSRVLFTQDRDLLAEAAARQSSGRHFTGVVYAHQLNVTIGQCVNDLELIGVAGLPEDLADTVWHLPLR